jgi:hypothetical protein
MHNKWIQQKKKSISEILRKMGVAKLSDITNCSLHIFIDYGVHGIEDGYSSVIKTNIIRFPNLGTIEFDFDPNHIRCSLDSAGHKYGGDLEEIIKHTSEIEIAAIGFSIKDGWFLIFDYKYQEEGIESTDKTKISQPQFQVEIIR